MNSTKISNAVFIIFGATGDLSLRKLLPAWYNLQLSGQLADDTKLIALGRRLWDRAEFEQKTRDSIRSFARFAYDEAKATELLKKLEYYHIEITQKEDYPPLWEHIAATHPGYELRLFLAIAPQLFEPIVRHIADTLPASLKNPKIVVEKPFGESLEHAKSLYDFAAKRFGKEQIYHIDHYLGKEMLINLLTLRFKNAIFRNAWGKDAIDFIEISAFEALGVEGRAAYYEEAGAMRDMVQNHLFQVLALVAMPEPNSFHWQDITAAKLEILRCLKPYDDKELDHFLCMGQYEGYRQEAGVDPQSKTETFVGLCVEFEHPYWKGVPFLIRTGKKLRTRETMVVVHYKKLSEDAQANKLFIHIQPNEGIQLSFNIKKPGQSNDVMQAEMDFCQSCMSESEQDSPEAYERLLRAVHIGARDLFSQWDEIYYAWAWVDKARERWLKAGAPLKQYPVNSYGPPEACDLVPPHCEGWYCNI
ncbi:MAG: glucose-6-phosphate dehydrogenase [Bradymonadales bacterium]